MTNNNRPAYTPSTMVSIIVTVSLCIIFGMVIFVLPTLNDLILVKYESKLTDKDCTAVDIYTENKGRSADMYTIFRDEAGNEYKKTTSGKDHIGRKTVLSVNSINTAAYRKSFEFMKLTEGKALFVFFMGAYTVICLIYYIFKGIGRLLKNPTAAR